jgi:hypothetical protein
MRKMVLDSSFRAALLLLLFALTARAQTIELQDGAFRVSGWMPDRPVQSQDLPAIFSVHTGPADTPAILGTYSMEGDVLVFRPRFPLATGLAYRAIFHAAGTTPLERVFDRKSEAVPQARVESVYPSIKVLPSNQLKLYVYFSAPMSRGEASKRIHWVDNNGKAREWPFLISEELWDPEQRRLTLILDPGRIKRGLEGNELKGPPILEGNEYTLAIDREFADARGVPLVEGFRKSFRGGPAVRDIIDPKRWLIHTPATGTSDPLIVDFAKPMDYALLESQLSVGGISGTVKIDRNETRWIFTPSQSWKSGRYELNIGFALEDLAGNRIDRPFDVDTYVRPSPPSPGETLTIPFRIP